MSNTERFMDYHKSGGKILALCSNLLYTLLPDFAFREIQENGLISFSYDKLDRVRWLQDSCGYQSSPKRKRFSVDHDDGEDYDSEDSR